MPAKFFLPLDLAGIPPHRADTPKHDHVDKVRKILLRFLLWVLVCFGRLGAALLPHILQCLGHGAASMETPPGAWGRKVHWETWEFTPSTSCCAADGFAQLRQVLSLCWEDFKAQNESGRVRGWLCP